MNLSPTLPRVLPDNWNVCVLSNVATLQGGYSFSSRLFQDNGVLLLRISNITSRGITRDDAVYLPAGVSEKHSSYQGLIGDIVIAMSGATTGKNARVSKKDIPLLINQRVGRFVIKNQESLDAAYLFNLINSARFQTEIVIDAVGGAQPNISSGHVERIAFNLPPLPEQRKIASILTTVDRLIEQTEALIEKYRRVKQGMMADLLSRGVDEHGKLRPTQQQAPQLYKESELGWIPKEWEVVPVGTILADIDAGWSPECIEKTPPLGEWGVLKVSAVSGGEYRAYESKTLPVNLPPRPEIEVRSGDVILTRSNGVAELVGLTVFVENTRSRLMLSDKIMRLWPVVNRVSNRFLALAMQSASTRRQIMQLISGSSGQRNISQLELRRLTTILPSILEQSAIVSALQSATNTLRQEVEVVAKLRTLKTGLMQDLLTGKVRVKVDQDGDAVQLTPSATVGVGA